MSQLKKTILILILILASCTVSSYVKINGVKYFVEVAETQEEIRTGLMFRENLDENKGMLFVFKEQMSLSFWMKNTKIPLDLLFIDDQNKIVDIKEKFQPCTKDPCETFTSKSAKYVLEVNAGQVKKRNFLINDLVDVKIRKLQ